MKATKKEIKVMEQAIKLADAEIKEWKDYKKQIKKDLEKLKRLK